MNEVDKIEIDSIVKCIEDTMKYRNSVSKDYYDEKVADFVVAAKEDYVSNKKEIIDVLNKVLRIREISFPADDDWHWFDINCGLKVLIGCDGSIKDAWYEGDDYYSSAQDLVDYNHNMIAKAVENGDLKSPHNADWWNSAYHIAVFTKLKNESLVSAFKTALKNALGSAKAEAEQVIAARYYTSSKSLEYTKVMI